MGRNPVLLLLLSVFVVSSLAINAAPTTNLSYIVVTSDVLLPGSLFVVDVHLLDLVRSEGKESEECVLDLKISAERLLWHRSNWKIDVEKTPKSFVQSVRLLVPEDALLKDKHVLEVESNSCFKFSRSVELRTERRDLLVSITTDRLKYTPGDLVLVKALVHSQELVPYLKPVNLSIYDSKHVPLVRWLNITSEEGLLLEVYKIPMLVKDDNLTIVLENHEQKVNHTVEVVHQTGPYEEELFKVDVRVPRYLTLQQSDESKGQSLEVRVVSSLCSGVPLEGSVELHLTLDTGKSGSLPPVELESGHKVISLKPEEVKQILSMSKSDSLSGHEVHVEVKVEEHRFLFERSEEMHNVKKDAKDDKEKEKHEEKKHKERHELESRDSKSKVYVTREFDVTFVDQSHVLFFTEFTPLFFKPGLTYVGQVLLKEVEEAFTGSSDEKEVTVNVKHYTSKSESPREEKVTLKLKSNSVGEFSFKVPMESTKLELEALFEDKEAGKVVKSELKDLLPFSTKDGQYVQILLQNKPPRVLAGEELKFTVEATFPYHGLKYKLLSQSLLVDSGMLFAPSETTKQDFTLEIPHNVSHLLSSTRLLVGVVTQSKEVLFDSVQFVVEEPQEHPLKVVVPEFAEPGREVEVTIKAEPFTKVYLVAMPEHLVYEPKEQELRKKVANEVLQRYLHRISTPELSQFIEMLCKTCTTIPSVAPDSQRVLNESGCLVLTDGVLSIDSSKPWPVPVRKNGTLDELELSCSQLVREFEMEFWKVEVEVGHSGEEKVEVKLPEESRLYTIGAFGVRPGRGLVVSEETVHLVAVPKVLASLEHPEQVVRGEEFVLEVHLYNHQEKNVEVEVTATENAGYKLVCLDGDKEIEESKFVRKVTLLPKQLEVIPVFVRSSSTIQEALELEVEVVSEGVRYKLNSSVEFKYQGYRVLLSESTMLDNFNGEQVLELNVSKNITNPIDKSERAFVRVFGHPLGPAIERVCRGWNYTHVLEERTKLWFVLAVNVLEHISNNSLFDNSVHVEYDEEEMPVKGLFEVSVEKEECIKSVRDSVEYLLYKRRDDGSYSFHHSAPGYIWLNTLMLDSLVQLRNVVSKDKLEIEKTLKWLSEQQQADGSFVEPKGVLMIRDEVEASNNVPLTSQVVTSLLEALENLELPKEIEELVSKVTKKAVEYIENVLQKGELDKDSYSLNVAAYALVLSMSEKVSEVLMKRDELVVEEGNDKYWKVEESDNLGENSLSLEATCYAILTSLAMDDLLEARAYVNHVSKHMRPNGAFVGVQVTSVALRALSKYHRLHDLFHEHHRVNVEVNVSLSNKEKVSLRVLSPFFVGNLYFDASNLSLSSPLKVETSGEGLVLVQSVPLFNEAVPSYKPVKFDLKVETKQESSEQLQLKVCAVNLEKEPSRFLFCEIPLLSGYELNMEKVEQKHNLQVLEQYDVVHVVFNEVQPGTPSCVELELEKVFKVGKSEPRYVKLYSVEEPFKPVVQLYKEEKPESGSKEICPQCKC